MSDLMLREKQILAKDFRAGGTISPYRFVKLDTDDNSVVQCTAQGEQAHGVVTSIKAGTTVAEGEPVTVCVMGMCPVDCGAVITKGARITTQADGEAEPAASGDFVSGVILETAADGDLITAFINCAAPAVMA